MNTFNPFITVQICTATKDTSHETSTPDLAYYYKGGKILVTLFTQKTEQVNSMPIALFDERPCGLPWETLRFTFEGRFRMYLEKKNFIVTQNQVSYEFHIERGATATGILPFLVTPRKEYILHCRIKTEG